MQDVLDTETCGLEGGVVELAVVHVDLEAKAIVGWDNCLVKPDRPIEVEAMAAHHLTPEMLEGSWDLAQAVRLIESEQRVAHNAEFDRKALGDSITPGQWVCTYRVAQHLWPDAPGYKNQVLRYWRGLADLEFPPEAGNSPHRALYDTWVTAHLLFQFDRNWEELVELTQRPILQKIVRFGKYRGQEWKDIPRDYLAYLLRGNFDDPDVLYTIKHFYFRGT